MMKSCWSWLRKARLSFLKNRRIRISGGPSNRQNLQTRTETRETCCSGLLIRSGGDTDAGAAKHRGAGVWGHKCVVAAYLRAAGIPACASSATYTPDD